MSEQIRGQFSGPKLSRLVKGESIVPFHNLQNFSPYPKYFAGEHNPFVVDIVGKKGAITYKEEVDNFTGETKKWIVATMMPDERNKEHKIIKIHHDENDLVREIKFGQGDTEVTITNDGIYGSRGRNRDVFWRLQLQEGKLQFSLQHNGIIKDSLGSLTSEEKRMIQDAGFDPALVPVMYNIQNIDDPLKRKNAFRTLLYTAGMTFSSFVYLLGDALLEEPAGAMMTDAHLLFNTLTTLPTLAMATNAISSLTGQMDGALGEMKVALQSGSLKFILNAIAHYMMTAPQLIGEFGKIAMASLTREVNEDALMVGPLALVPSAISYLKKK